MLAVPYGATPQVGQDYAAELKGKVVLDAGNPYPSRDGDMAVATASRYRAWPRPNICPGCAWCVHSTPSIQDRSIASVSQTRNDRHSACGRRPGGDENCRATGPRRGLRSVPWANYRAPGISITAHPYMFAA